MPSEKRRRAATSPIDRALAKSDVEFVKDYLEPAAWTHPTSGRRYCIRLARPEELGERAIEACFRLVEETSRADYEQSTMRWRPKQKRQEMRSPELRYIVVQEEAVVATEVLSDHTGEPAPDPAAVNIPAFTSLMPVYEEGEPVVYCYEIHLAPDLRGSGLGSLLLGFQSIVAHNLGPPISKVMLTCFLSNSQALQFYKNQGFVTDELAPTTRRLRGGKVFRPDYTILSKPVVR